MIVVDTTRPYVCAVGIAQAMAAVGSARGLQAACLRAGKLCSEWPRISSSFPATSPRRASRSSRTASSPSCTSNGGARSPRGGTTGDIYLGKVTRVLPGLAGRLHRHRPRAGRVPPRRRPDPAGRLRGLPRGRAQARARERRGRPGGGSRGGGRHRGRRRRGAKRRRPKRSPRRTQPKRSPSEDAAEAVAEEDAAQETAGETAADPTIETTVNGVDRDVGDPRRRRGERPRAAGRVRRRPATRTQADAVAAPLDETLDLHGARGPGQRSRLLRRPRRISTTCSTTRTCPASP